MSALTSRAAMTDWSPVVATNLQPDEVESARLQRLLAYWHELKGQDPLPPRERFDPTAIGYVLAQVMLIEVLREPLDFFIRLVGTAAEEVGYRDYQGRSLNAVEPRGYREMLWRHYTEVVASGMPSCYRVEMIPDGHDLGRAQAYQRVILPFSNKAGEVGFLLVGADWRSGATRAIAAAYAKIRGQAPG